MSFNFCVLPFDRQKNQKSKYAGHAKTTQNFLCIPFPAHPPLSLLAEAQSFFFLLQPYKCTRFFNCNPINAHLTWTVFEELIYLVLVFYVKNLKVPKNQPKEKLGPAI